MPDATYPRSIHLGLGVSMVVNSAKEEREYRIAVGLLGCLLGMGIGVALGSVWTICAI